MQRGWRWGTALLVGLLAIWLPACSSNPPQQATPTTQDRSCRLLTASEVQRATGVKPFLQKRCLFDLQDGTTVTAALVPFDSQPADFCHAGTVHHIAISADASICSVGQGVTAHMTVGQQFLYVQWIDATLTDPPQSMFVAVENLLVLAFPRSAS